MKLHCQSWGSAPKSTKETAQETTKIDRILFLHGLGGTGALWRPIAATLEEEYTLLAPDQRGHGKSVIPQESSVSYGPLEFGKDLEETLQATGFYSAWVVGHSMGVRSACALAHLRPDFVKGLVLIDLGLQAPADTGLHKDLHTFLKILPESFSTREAARDFMNEKSPDPSIGQYLMAVSTRSSDGGIRFPFDRNALLRILEQARGTDLRPWVRDFAALGKPVLLLRGELSQVWTRQEFEAERLQFQHLKSVRFLEIPSTGHGLPFEKRREFTAALLEFMRAPTSYVSPTTA